MLCRTLFNMDLQVNSSSPPSATYVTPLALRLLLQTMLSYDTGVKVLALDGQRVLQKDLYEAIAALGQSIVVVHNTELRYDIHQSWSIIYHHKHLHHVCGQDGWEWPRSYDDDLSEIMACKLIIGIDNNIPHWLLGKKEVTRLRIDLR